MNEVHVFIVYDKIKVPLVGKMFEIDKNLFWLERKHD